MLNLLNFNIGALKSLSRRVQYLLIAAAFFLAGLMPIILQASAGAATLENRSLTLSSSADGATVLGQGVDYTFEFDLATSGNVGSVEILFCTTPLGTCTAPTGMDYSTAGSLNTTNDTINAVDAGFTDGAGNTANLIQVTRTPAAQVAGQTVFLEFNGVDNPDLSGNSTSFYARITVSSDAAYTTDVDDGTVAGAIVDQLTVTGRVQERLVFCVFALDDADGSAAAGPGGGDMPENCSAASASESTNVDIGIIDNLAVTQSPVDNSPPSSIGNDRFGAAQVNTNASNGVVVAYYATAASSGTEELRAFRVPGAACVAGGTNLQDQCFISADETTGETFVAGTERFGLQIPCVANNATAGAALGSTSNLGANGTGSGTGGTFNTVYSNTDDNVADDGSSDCENSDTGVKFGWNDTAIAQPIISSDTVVDDEIVKMNFGAAAAATTPTGTYTVASTFIATATF